MFKSIKEYTESRSEEYPSISDARKKLLRSVSDHINHKLSSGSTVKLNFICTHNSRRSHFAQIWTSIAIHYYELEGLETYSGGTEVTSFNQNAIESLERTGFRINKPDTVNPRYELKYDVDADPMICYSKLYDDPVNPDSDFIAIMTCSDADGNCPLIPGADLRYAITYPDPKYADGTAKQSKVYDQTCRVIAREMMYMISRIE